MAVFNEIGIGRWNRFIQKLTDIKGGPPARQLASEIVFQHPIFHGAENRYLESWDRFALTLTVGPIAAQSAGVRLRNPPGSNVIAVIEKAAVSVTPSTFANLEYGTPGGADLSNAAVAIPLETRGRSASSLIASFNAAALATLNPISQVGLLATAPYDFIVDRVQEISVPPGGAVQIDESAVNTQVSVTFWWRERFLEPAERK